MVKPVRARRSRRRPSKVQDVSAGLGRRPLDDGIRDFDIFEELLAEHGVEIEAGSPLEGAYLALSWAGDVHRGSARYESIAQATELSRAMSVHSMIRRALTWPKGGFFDVALPHLKLLAKVGVTGAQNVRSQARDQATKKLFELFVASIVFSLDQRAVLEDPQDGRPSKNPDILFDYRGERWGIACKTLSTLNPKTYAQRLAEGVEQIGKSEAERGMVAFNLSGILPYHELYSHMDREGRLVERIFQSGSEALRIVREFQIRHTDEMIRSVSSEGWMELLGRPMSTGGYAPKADVPKVLLYTELAPVVRPRDGKIAYQHSFSLDTFSIHPAGDVDVGAVSLHESLKRALREVETLKPHEAAGRKQ